MTKILLLVKRKYMGRLLPDDRYGRFFELPVRIASQSTYQVTVCCLDYRASGSPNSHTIEGVEWICLPFPFKRPLALPGAVAALDAIVSDIQPDLILSASDAYCVALGGRLAASQGSLHVVDLYDNFDAYAGTWLPGLRSRYLAAIESADQVNCISQPLAEHLAELCQPRGEVGVLENGVETIHFHPRSKVAARATWGLPIDAPIIGTVGALHPNRDSALLFEAHRQLRASIPELQLVVAGPLHRSLRRYLRHDGVRYLGMVDYGSVPELMSAIDVHVISNRDSSFGRYCYPQKFWEVVACGRPLVAADVGAVSLLLKDYPNMRYRVGDREDLAGKLAGQLADRELVRESPVTWDQVARRLGDRLTALIERTRDGSIPRHP